MNGCTPGKRRRGRTGGGGAGGVGPARGVTGRTWCAAPCKPLFLRRRAPRLPGPRHRQRAGRGAPLPANSYSFVARHHVFRGHGAGGGPDVVRRSCKPLFLRRRAPRLPGPRHRQRAGRGAPLPANSYSFVARHHVFRGHGAGGGPDVVRRSPQTLVPSSPGTTSSGAMAPATGRTWCAAHRKPLFLRRRAPRLPGPWRRRRTRRGAPLPATPYSFVARHHVFRG